MAMLDLCRKIRSKMMPMMRRMMGGKGTGARMSYHLDPLRAVAAWHQGFGVPVYGGVNQWNEPIADISPEINATGAGARPDMDGVDGAGAYFATMSDCSDVETTESDRPFLYLFTRLCLFGVVLSG